MPVALSSLRVSAEIDASQYVTGMRAKVAADAEGAQSSKEVGEAVTATNTKLSDSGGVLGRLSRQYIDGFSSAQRFDKAVASLGRGIETGNVPIEQASILLDGIYKKFGLAANASELAKNGQIELASVVSNLNSKYAVQNEIVERATVATKAAADAQAYQASINSRLGVTNDFGTDARAADIAAYGKQLDQLRSKYVPLFAIQQQYRQSLADINEAARVGAISEGERAAAVQRSKDAFAAQVIALRNVGQAGALSAFQLTNLSFQLNDVVSGLAMGQSPFMIMAQQGGQVYQILQTAQGGVTGALKDLGGKLIGLVTPARLAFGGILAGIGTVVAAYASWDSSQKEIQRGLMGIGAASGATVASINAIASSVSSLSTISVSEARGIAVALASTGKVGVENIGQITALAHDFARTLNIDIADAGKQLASVFADPARGAEELNKRLGFLDAAMQRQIANLVAQNRLYEAQQVLIKGVQSSTAGAADTTGLWSRGWTVLGNLASNLFNNLGQEIDSFLVDSGAAESQLVKWRERVTQLQAQVDSRGPVISSMLGTTSLLDEAKKKVSDLEAQIEKLGLSAVGAKTRMDSLFIRGVIDHIVPEINQIQDLLAKVRVTGAASEDSVLLQSLGLTQKDVDLAKSRAKEASDSFKTAQEQALSAGDIALKAINARSPSERSSIAFQQTMLSLAGQNISAEEKLGRARLAGIVAFKEAQHELTESARERIAAVRDAIDQTGVDIQTIGRNVGQVELLKANWQAYSDLRREAERNHTQFDDAQYARLVKQNEVLAAQKQLLAETKLQSDIRFERSQIGLSDSEQAINARLRSIYGDNLNSSQAQFYAQQLRINDAMKQFSDIGKDALSGFLTDLKNGKSGTEALGNALSKISDKLISMAVDNIWGKAFGSFGSNIFSFITGGYTPSPSIAVGTRHGGGMANVMGEMRYVHPSYFDSAPRFHTGGVIGPDEIGIIAKKNEEVLTRDDPRHVLNGGKSGGVYITQHNDFRGVDPSMKTYIDAKLQQNKQETIAAAAQAVNRTYRNTPNYLRKN